MTPQPEPEPQVPGRLRSPSGLTRIGWVAVPIAATLLAFLIGGLVVLITGSNPITAYKAIFEGTGLNWFFPWVGTGETREDAANDLQQTLSCMTPSSWPPGRGRLRVPVARALQHRRPGPVLGRVLRRPRYRDEPRGDVAPAAHPLALGASIVAAGWAASRASEGDRGRARGDHDDHAELDRHLRRRRRVEIGGHLQGPEPFIPRSDTVLESRRAVADLGQPAVAPRGHLHRALRACRLPRDPEPDDARLRGARRRLEPEAARYGGISVPRTTVPCARDLGAFAGLAGSVDLLGFKSAVSTGDFATNLIPFTGIAVALLGRNKAVGILLPPCSSPRSRSAVDAAARS